MEVEGGEVAEETRDEIDGKEINRTDFLIY